MPQDTSQRSILILYFHLRVGLPNGLFPSSFHTKILYELSLAHIRATCLAYLSLITSLKLNKTN
jgi:hypothetical protein